MEDKLTFLSLIAIIFLYISCSSSNHLYRSSDSGSVERATEINLDQIEKQLSKTKSVNYLFQTDKSIPDLYQRVLSSKLEDKDLQAWNNLIQKSSEQMTVRARYILANYYLEKKMYEIAYQSYEELIARYGFSSIALKSLDKIMICAQNLNMEYRYDFYKGLKERFSHYAL